MPTDEREALLKNAEQIAKKVLRPGHSFNEGQLANAILNLVSALRLMERER
jgi:hypothetical protein